MKTGLLIALAIVAVLFLSGIGVNNSLVMKEEAVTAAWANVDVVLQRRYDLIPNVVNTVKGFAAQEQEVLTEVTRLRSQWGAAKASGDPGESIRAAGMLEGALGRLMVVVEKYPELKSNQNFLALQEELSGTENRISVERRRYNLAVQDFNSSIRRFPASIIAGMRGFTRKTPFEAAPESQAAPVVQF